MVIEQDGRVAPRENLLCFYGSKSDRPARRLLGDQEEKRTTVRGHLQLMSCGHWQERSFDPRRWLVSLFPIVS